MMRRLVTFLTVAAATAAGTTWWLYDGDLAAAIEPLTSSASVSAASAGAAWDADALAAESLSSGPPAAVLDLGVTDPAPAPVEP